MESLGGRLREARERQGLSLDAVESSTRIRKAYLVALESEDYAVLPHPTYVKGFLKTYAKFLNLEVQEVLDLYPHRDQRPVLTPIARLEKPRLGLGFWVVTLALLVLVVALAAYLFSNYAGLRIPLLPEGSDAVPTPTLVEPALPPVSAAISPFPVKSLTPPAAPSPSATATLAAVEVRSRVIARSWVWVIVDSTPVFTGTLEPGQERTWVGQEKVFMRVGNAGGLVIVHNGQDRGVLGKDGQVLDVQWTKDSMSFDINPPLPGPR